MLPRPVRAVVIGFPNVGKSALINRPCSGEWWSAARPGVTRQLRWIHLRSAGATGRPWCHPCQVDNQTDALKLAICDDIGDGAYDNQRVAAALVDLLKQLEASSADLLPKSPYSPATDSIPHLHGRRLPARFGAATQSRRCRTHSTAAVDRFSQRLAGR